MSDQIGKLLEQVADEALATCDRFAIEYQKRDALSVLEERLGPLLRAGQAMREWKGKTVGLQAALKQYDAALERATGLAALEGRDGK